MKKPGKRERRGEPGYPGKKEPNRRGERRIKEIKIENRGQRVCGSKADKRIGRGEGVECAYLSWHEFIFPSEETRDDARPPSRPSHGIVIPLCYVTAPCGDEEYASTLYWRQITLNFKDRFFKCFLSKLLEKLFALLANTVVHNFQRRSFNLTSSPA